MAKEIGLDGEQFKKDLYSEETIKSFHEKMNLRRMLNLNSFPSLALKNGKNINKINIKYNQPEAMLAQINNLIKNSN